jgi:hypothetical protein
MAADGPRSPYVKKLENVAICWWGGWHSRLYVRVFAPVGGWMMMDGSPGNGSCSLLSLWHLIDWAVVVQKRENCERTGPKVLGRYYLPLPKQASDGH